MDEWLRQAWGKTKNPFIRAIVLFLIVFWMIVAPVARASDVGFGEEVQRYRVLILIVAVVVALIVAVGWLYCYMRQKLAVNEIEIKQLRERVVGLRGERDRFEQEKESAFELMKSYKAQTQEDVMKQLEGLAIFSIMEENWRKKEARVERLRTEEAAALGSDSSEFEILQRIAAVINLGAQDKVSEGMRFIVRDPVDSYEYGLIEIRRVDENGSTCSVLEISNQALWEEALRAAQEGRSNVSETLANAITPDTALKGISRESAEELVIWLQKIKRIDL